MASSVVSASMSISSNTGPVANHHSAVIGMQSRPTMASARCALTPTSRMFFAPNACEARVSRAVSPPYWME